MDNSLMNLGTTASLFSSSACDFSMRVRSIEDNSKGINKVSSYVNDVDCPEKYFALCLGQSLNSLDVIKKSSMIVPASSVTEIDKSCDLGLNFQLLHGDAKTSNPKSIATPDDSHIGNSLDLQLSLSIGSSGSVISGIKHFLDPIQYSLEASAMVSSVPTNDEEGTSSSCWMFGGYMDTTFHNSETSGSFSSGKIGCKEYDSLDGAVDHPLTMFNTLKSPIVFTSEITHLQHNSTKNCQFQGCVKRARGASGLCIAHGGGRRCQKLGCQKGAEGRTIFCKAHGGGHRCEHLGCTKSAEGRTDYCIAHGGGRRCIHENCSHAARGKSGLCIRHGGGKRCKKENCTKSAEGYTGLCISHGGGKRCQFPSCTKGAQGSTMFCKAHGGGKRCTFLGCTKGAEGSTLFCKGHGGGKRCLFDGGGVCPKSVHGGTLFCVAHGGGKRCVAPSCTKSARGRTSYCVRHGGGRRCKYEGCGKSAQGSTDFCKAHGGGKHCAWGQLYSNVGVGDAPCDRFSRTKAGLCAAHHSLQQDQCIHDESTAAVFSTRYQTFIKTEEGAIAGKGVSGWSASDTAVPTTDCRSVSLPEGRVHGGNLMAMLASSSTTMCNDG
ncbi:uncharacterized protein LOC121969759 [Zingiber officinale]|uniref:WRKY19-like zinc finger domain-containing protein n=1 Tax=Zingiber officinale TaxID=94328 RepID=A0A8J5GXW5_ZINOF|nr:uncharacterized protein LOC121969759 [Zingiber officinale]XP_042375930.1 uncharacterized protein LOC121969759 [Zingiber officinale]XP_042375931.1 uncharacterized protein LOC121969759 [Zingiber officinale]KAG6513853.1 hypothetical protein ZIOFF_024190 [Zingiber officinale]